MPNYDFEASFAKSIEDAKAGRTAALLALALHPLHHILSHARHPNVSYASDPHLEAWMGPEAPWLGAGLWAMPASLEAEMLKAGCGALWSHGHFKTAEDRAYIEHLGPLGAQVGGASWNNDAFECDGLPIKFCVGSFEIKTGSGRSLMEGMPRPSYWPEPLPMVRRVWGDEDPPEEAVDFAAVALLLAAQCRESVAQAIHEETGADRSRIEEILGGVGPLANAPARHFTRQEHPMFGATALTGKDREEALMVAQAARSAFERSSIEPATGPGSPATRLPRL